MNESVPDHGNSAFGEEIDLRELFGFLWKKRLHVVLCSFACWAIAAFYAFRIVTPVFESSALMLPTQGAVTDQLGTAAALLGKKTTGNPDVELYQSLLTSRTVIHQLLQSSVHDFSDSGKARVVPLFSLLQVDTTDPLQLEDAIKDMGKSILVNAKETGTGGIIEIYFNAETPWLAQEIGANVLSIGQEELRQVRIERANVILSRLVLAVDQAKAEWDSAARTEAWYKDRNRSISLPEQMLQLARIEMDKSAKEQKYMLARRESESQQLEKAKAAPPLMVLDPPNLPARKSKPKRSLIMAMGLLFGLVSSSVVLLGLKAFAKGNVHPAPPAGE